VNEYHVFGSRIATTAQIVGKQITVGPFTVIEDHVLLDSGSSNKSIISIGWRCKIKQGVVLRTYGGEIHIGNRVSIGEYSVLAGHSRLIIGDCTIIAAHCYISAANHIFSNDWIIRFQGEISKGINIGKDCWVGGNTMVLDGVNIGDGCVVGAGSVVTKNLPPNTICRGNPCQVVRTREPFLKSEENGNEIRTS